MGRRTGPGIFFVNEMIHAADTLTMHPRSIAMW